MLCVPGKVCGYNDIPVEEPERMMSKLILTSSWGWIGRHGLLTRKIQVEVRVEEQKKQNTRGLLDTVGEVDNRNAWLSLTHVIFKVIEQRTMSCATS